MTDRHGGWVSCLALLVGLVIAGLGAQAAGLDTQRLVIAVPVVGVGVFLGVALGKVGPRR